MSWLDWLYLTPTITVGELLGALIAAGGLVLSYVNLIEARRSARLWQATGRNGLVLMAARANVVGEGLRIGILLCFLTISLAGFATGPPASLALVTIHVAMVIGSALVVALSALSWRTRQRMEAEETGP